MSHGIYSNYLFNSEVQKCFFISRGTRYPSPIVFLYTVPSQYQTEISSKNTTITGINKTLQECYLVQKYKDEDLKQIEEIMNLRDEEGSKNVSQQQPPQITNKTYIEGIRFINRQYDSIK